MRLPRRVKKAAKAQLTNRPRTPRQRRLAMRFFRRLAEDYRRWERELGPPPHIVGMDPPTPENDPVGRFPR
jgi:hypothetical protein